MVNEIENIKNEMANADQDSILGLAHSMKQLSGSQLSDNEEPEQCCYGCETMRSACTNPNGENYGS